MTQPMSVLVTGVGGRSVGHQVLQALMHAGNGYRPVVADANTFSYGLYNTERRYLLPLANSSEYLDAIRRVIQREGIVVALPGTQAETEILSKNADSLGAGCRVVANSPEVIDRCKGKKVLQDWLAANGFCVPRAVDALDWQTLVKECGFPIVGKPTEETGGSRGVAILADEDEVRMYLHGNGPDKVMFQQYVGDLDSEYTVGVMVSKTGRMIDSIVIHRHLVGLSLGVTRKINGKIYGLSTGYSQGTIRKHEQIQSVCEALALKIGARGPLNIQLRLSQGNVVIFEVHPRFSGTTSIRAQVGFNEVDTLIRNFVLGEEFSRIHYQTDVAAIRAFCNVIVPAGDMGAVPRG